MNSFLRILSSIIIIFSSSDVHILLTSHGVMIMNSIHTNMGALTAQKNMQVQNERLDEAMERLSSGLRINSAADDAAGSAIASKMEAQVRSLDVAIRNSYDAISMTQTAEGALGEMENILQRVQN